MDYIYNLYTAKEQHVLSFSSDTDLKYQVNDYFTINNFENKGQNVFFKIGRIKKVTIINVKAPEKVLVKELEENRADISITFNIFLQSTPSDESNLKNS